MLETKPGCRGPPSVRRRSGRAAAVPSGRWVRCTPDPEGLVKGSPPRRETDSHLIFPRMNRITTATHAHDHSGITQRLTGMDKPVFHTYMRKYPQTETSTKTRDTHPPQKASFQQITPLRDWEIAICPGPAAASTWSARATSFPETGTADEGERPGG